MEEEGDRLDQQAKRDPLGEIHALGVGVVRNRVSFDLLCQLVERYIREHAYILETAHVAELTMALLEYRERLAKKRLPYSPEELLKLVELGVQHQLRIESRAPKDALDARPESSERDQFLVVGLGVKPDHARVVASRYNGLPERARQAFFSVAVGNKTLREAMAANVGMWKTESDIAADIMAAVFALLGRGNGSLGDAK